MQKQLATWQLIQKCLLQNEAVMLLYVLHSEGSSPGRQGFMMAVPANGKSLGSIGGGIMEHKFTEMAKARLLQQGLIASLQLQVHSKEVAANQSGMICSGRQSIFMYQVREGDAPVIAALINSLINYENGTLTLTPRGISFDNTASSGEVKFEKLGDDDFRYEVVTGYLPRLYVIGGGHCALAVCQVMSNLDFYIQVLDDREELDTIEKNSYAHHIRQLPDYSDLTELIPAGESSYVVVMTSGYRTDALALKALLGKQYKYLGVLGSKSKINKLFSDLRAEGFGNEVLQNLHAPVGMKINSRTPEEIAISIAAEIIMVRSASH